MYPKNPNNILVSNEWYPTGLNELSAYKYYLYEKFRILDLCSHRPLILFLVPFKNHILVKRKTEDGKLIYLTETNYDKIIHPRVLSISLITDEQIDSVPLDLDFPDNYSEDQKKEVVNKVIEFSTQIKEVRNHRIYNSGSGYHLWLELNRLYNTNMIRKKVEELLKGYFKDEYHINKKAKQDKPNIDLTAVYPNNSITVPHGLCRNGLACKPVKDLDKYQRKQSVIKIYKED